MLSKHRNKQIAVYVVKAFLHGKFFTLQKFAMEERLFNELLDEALFNYHSYRNKYQDYTSLTGGGGICPSIA